MSDNARQIKARLLLLGKTAASIARKVGVSRQTVSAVIAGKTRSARIEKALVAEGIPRKLLKGARKKAA
ncbi:MAG: helix-turn-helix domain-containing protein [Syntrophobacteraceae bacterium]|nr:helix-turn-helix domain-containing protein [Desulfobacteraceae bacterium]